VFITHNLAMAAWMADQIAVLDHGRIVERGPASEVLRQPTHAATRALIAATPKWNAQPHSQADQ
jgi:ABC-type dipeptide/oligopeptide/nickel transport system ATPase component